MGLLPFLCLDSQQSARVARPGNPPSVQKQGSSREDRKNPAFQNTSHPLRPASSESDWLSHLFYRAIG